MLWVGSDDGLVHVTRNGGETWDNVTPKNMPEWTMINSIEPSSFDEGTCYVAGTRYKWGDFQPYLYKTTDYGKSWTKITNGINEEHFTRALREDPKQKGLLYAGTETGMYISFNDGKNWKPFQLNLPIVPITDLTIKDNNLIVATQGRSLWIIDDLSVIHQAMNVSNKDVALMKPKPTYRMQGGSREGSLTSGTNHPSGVMTYFYLKNYDEKKDTISVTYLNKQNDTLKSFSNHSKKDKLDVEQGANLTTWDTRSKGAEVLDGMILWWANLDAPRAYPDTYKVRLNVNGKDEEQSFEIIPNPNSESTAADMKAQYEFISDVNETVDKAHKSIKNIRAINKQLKDFQEQYKDDERTKELREKAKKLQDDFTAIEEALYQTKNRSGQDPLNFPIKLTNKLGHLNSLVGMGDFAPTEQDKAVKRELEQQINAELVKFDNLVTQEISEFNTQFNNLKLNYLFVEDKE